MYTIVPRHIVELSQRHASVVCSATVCTSITLLYLSTLYNCTLKKHSSANLIEVLLKKTYSSVRIGLAIVATCDIRWIRRS
jgi:hypothetical protein